MSWAQGLITARWHDQAPRAYISVVKGFAWSRIHVHAIVCSDEDCLLMDRATVQATCDREADARISSWPNRWVRACVGGSRVEVNKRNWSKVLMDSSSFWPQSYYRWAVNVRGYLIWIPLFIIRPRVRWVYWPTMMELLLPSQRMRLAVLPCQAIVWIESRTQST